RVRLFDSQVNRSSEILVKVLSAAVRLPSGATPFSRSNQRSPSRVQRPSAKPPSSSKVHERMQLSIGSHPMISQPSSVVSPLRFTVTLRVMKLPPRAHTY